jgi:hypothetical protein
MERKYKKASPKQQAIFDRFRKREQAEKQLISFLADMAIDNRPAESETQAGSQA